MIPNRDSQQGPRDHYRDIMEISYDALACEEDICGLYSKHTELGSPSVFRDCPEKLPALPHLPNARVK